MVKNTVRHKHHGVFCAILQVLVLLLFLVSLSGTSEAGVQLVPRVNTHGEILKNEAGAPIAHESYVLFGAYKHKTDNTGNTPESAATPVIWRVMSADAAHGSQKNAILLTHYLMDKMRYHGSSNVWSTSNVRTWLNGSFLTDFSANEKSSMLDYPDGVLSSKVTLPSFWTDDYIGAASNWIYEGELKDWFGSNDVTNNEARRAGFKGASGSAFWYWWTRSPVASFTHLAWDVNDDGDLDYDGSVAVNDSSVAVRPACLLNLESLIFKSASNDFDLNTPFAVEAGSIFNPYVLVIKDNAVSLDQENVSFVSADKTPDGAKINGKELIVSWDVAISPAVRQWPISTDFTLTVGGSATEHPTSVTSDDANPKLLKLTFATGVAYGATVKLSYNLNTDAISYDVSGNTASVVNSFSDITVTNSTPSGGGGTTLSSATTPSGVCATLGATPYAAQTQPDGTYLITLPSGTDLKAIKINMTLPTGATISPGLSGTYNFASENPKKFTITAQDGTTKKVITIQVIAPTEPPTEKTVLTTNASDCAVIYTRTSDGTIAVEIRIPFISGITPADLENLMLGLKNSGLSNIRFSWVDANGNVVPYRTAVNKSASIKAPYLQITGNAPSVASLANEAITKFSYKTKGSATQYVQTFPDGGLKLSAMNVTDNTKESSGSSGCNAGFGSAGLLAMGMVLLGLNKTGARKKK